MALCLLQLIFKKTGDVKMYWLNLAIVFNQNKTLKFDCARFIFSMYLIFLPIDNVKSTKKLIFIVLCVFINA